MVDKLRVGLVGTGFGTRVHLPGYRHSGEVEVVGVCSAQRERAQAAAAAWDIPFATDDFIALVQRPDVDLIDVCTPPRTHREIVLAALDAGKHVLCEKPFAAWTAEADDMVEAAERAGVVHAVNHEMRYDPVRRHLRELVLDGYLGRPQFIVVAVHADQGTNPAQEPYYWGWVGQADQGGGFAMSSLSHHLDLVQFTFGSIDDVQARTTTLIPERPVLTFEYRDGDPIGPDTPTVGTRRVDADDTVVLHGTVGGALLSVSGSWSLRFPAGNRVDVYGDEGTLHLRADGSLVGARVGDTGLQPLVPPPALDLETIDGAHRLTPHFSALARELAATVRGEAPGPLMATFEDGLQLQRVLDEARGLSVTVV